MLSLSLLGSAMGDRDFWRCIIEPRYGTPPPLSALTLGNQQPVMRPAMAFLLTSSKHVLPSVLGWCT